tara:strand:+ start:168 stop:761 length:594 start_codon:yes stop_codon:yes gene_type:complete
MPYTKEELVNVGFYNNHIEKLRGEYFSKLIHRAKTKFRDDNNIFYSFEDIDSTFGIEDAELQQNPTYRNLETALNRPIVEALGYITFEELFQYEACSIQNRTLNKINKEEVGLKSINRVISELSPTEVAETLPDDIQNGDFIMVNKPGDVRKWLIEQNQKRIFPDLATFYGSGFSFAKLKEKPIDIINQIPDGEPVE